MDFLNLSETETLKLNKDKLQKCVLDIKKNIPPGLSTKNLILNSFKEIKADIKQLQDDIEEMKDDFTPLTNQNVSGSVFNNLLKLEKEHYELRKYSRRNNVEILGLPNIFTSDRLTEKVVELCKDLGVMIQAGDIEACHRLFQKESNNQLPKRTIVRFVNRRFAEDLLSKRNISSTLDLNKLGFPRGTQIYFNANLCGYYKKLWGMCKELKISGSIKYLWETSGNIKIRRDSGTADIKVLHQRDLT